jgi:hypothetical protein
MRLCSLILVILSLSCQWGCTWQQAYDTAQAWQRNACLRIMDTQERERCLAGTRMSYEDYRRRIEIGKNER